jgi:membrane-associated phospholipid phosphatase
VAVGAPFASEAPASGGRVALAAVDRLTLAYVLVALAFTAAHGPRSLPLRTLVLAGLVAAALVAAVIAPRARGRGRLGSLLAEFYPLLLTLGFYTHVGVVNRAGGVAHDALVQRWEQALFGGQLSTAWVRAFPSPAWSTLMHAAYVSYYLILAGSPLGLWLSGRRAAARATLFAMMATFYLCYTAFLVFPVAGPRYAFAQATNAATAVPAAVLARRLLETFSAWGTAFPSSHVAVAIVAAVCAWRGFRPLGLALVPAALLLTLATVYGQFHYAVDAVAGAFVALMVLLGARPARQYDSAPDEPPRPRRV